MSKRARSELYGHFDLISSSDDEEARVDTPPEPQRDGRHKGEKDSEKRLSSKRPRKEHSSQKKKSHERKSKPSSQLPSPHSGVDHPQVIHEEEIQWVERSPNFSETQVIISDVDPTATTIEKPRRDEWMSSKMKREPSTAATDIKAALSSTPSGEAECEKKDSNGSHPPPPPPPPFHPPPRIGDGGAGWKRLTMSLASSRSREERIPLQSAIDERYSGSYSMNAPQPSRGSDGALLKDTRGRMRSPYPSSSDLRSSWKRHALRPESERKEQSGDRGSRERSRSRERRKQSRSPSRERSDRNRSKSRESRRKRETMSPERSHLERLPPSQSVAPPSAAIDPTPIGEEDRNRLKAAALKAKLRGDLATFQQLQAKLDSMPLSTSSHPPTSQNNTKDRRVEIISEYDRDHRPIALAHHKRGSKHEDDMSIEELAGEERRNSRRSDNMDHFLAENISRSHRFRESQVFGSSSSSSSFPDEFLDEDGDATFCRDRSRNYDHKRPRESSKKLERSQQINEHRRVQQMHDSCYYCFSNHGIEKSLPKHMRISLGDFTFLCLPKKGLLVSGHCQIVPNEHETNSRGLTDDAWNEVENFKKHLQKMFRAHDMEAIFFETCYRSKKQAHTVIDCVPLPIDVGQDAPLYFQKAIMEVEKEFSATHKPIYHISAKKDLRATIPAGFPYFSVEFGSDRTGFVHIIEDESRFTRGFAKEILGGILQLPPEAYLRDRFLSIDQQVDQVKRFLIMWKPFDWTQLLDGGDYLED